MTGNYFTDEPRHTVPFDADLAPQDPQKSAPEPFPPPAAARKGDYIETYLGNPFWPLDPRPEEVNVHDIAHSLAMKTRFNGMCGKHYSVAEHAVRCATYALATTRDEIFALAVLHHDSSETYLPDVPRPIKPYLTNFKDIEDGIQRAVYVAFDIPPLTPRQEKNLKQIDTMLLATEARDLMTPGALDRWNLGVKPLPERIRPWTKRRAERRFHLWHQMLTNPKTDNLARFSLDLLTEYGAVTDYDDDRKLNR